jgi:hypothetical protein
MPKGQISNVRDLFVSLSSPLTEASKQKGQSKEKEDNLKRQTNNLKRQENI